MPLADFRTLTLRISPTTKSATAEGFSVLSQGDSIKLVLTNLPGADVSSLSFYLFTKATPPEALISPATSFAEVPDSSNSFYASADISSATLTTALASVLPGNALVARLYVADSNAVWADCDIAIQPSPHLSAESWPVPEAPFAETPQVILRSDLLTGLAPISIMPTLSAAQREARFEALLSMLTSLATPE